MAWSLDEPTAEALRAGVAAGIPFRALGTQLRVSPDTLRIWARRLGYRERAAISAPLFTGSPPVGPQNRARTALVRPGGGV